MKFPKLIGCTTCSGYALLYDEGIYCLTNEVFYPSTYMCPNCYIIDEFVSNTVPVMAVTNPYWKPCGHSVSLTCNCPNNGTATSVEGGGGSRDVPPVVEKKISSSGAKCTCEIVKLCQDGCTCGAIEPYKGGLKE